jgi:hypothetical protein
MKRKNTGVETRKGSPSTTQIVRLKKPYEGGDVLMEWHKEKMKSTLHDADYATPIWRCETDWDRFKEYVQWGGMWAFLLGSLYLMATCFEVVMS